jgi:hypothetical protein
MGLREDFWVDDRRVDDGVRPDPPVGGVRPHLGRVTQGDVIDVEQGVFALPVPDLPAGVARVRHDGADRTLRPRGAAAVGIAFAGRAPTGRRG